ncbi:hypothetical protein BJ508DRAFT_115647 [Ascobolus immersus RN42]|uniref:Uncharacterized protein n=1 Tax=Ascobolus immersus RN42 TaxID=1160509 RepID=A0A3N4I6Y8_ASCIM|nr:hypothetical protein BJ508DRAFT_115647 [Ascobolus immersus RN42]
MISSTTYTSSASDLSGLSRGSSHIVSNNSKTTTLVSQTTSNYKEQRDHRLPKTTFYDLISHQSRTARYNSLRETGPTSHPHPQRLNPPEISGEFQRQPCTHQFRIAPHPQNVP